MAKVQLSYKEAQDIVRAHLQLSSQYDVVIERKDAQARRTGPPIVSG